MGGVVEQEVQIADADHRLVCRGLVHSALAVTAGEHTGDVSGGATVNSAGVSGGTVGSGI